tara:strand:- start:1909 stop:2217 length:309 start_codon:yes stop_codon:yes gene_type:complete
MTEPSHSQVWAKLKSIKGLRALIQKALLLYVLLIDADTPAWVKAAVIAALIYLVDPIDAIPDITPLIGYLDDLAVISAAIKALANQIKPHHHTRSDDMYREL